MSRRTALVVSSSLTVFVLVVVAALVARLGVSNASPTTAPAGAEAAIPQEQRYRQRLEEANTRLQQAYAQVSALEAENASLRRLQQPASGAPPASTGQREPRVASQTWEAISAEQAAQIALQLVGGGRVRSVELERERDASVYEIKVGSSKVYVDASTGQAALGKNGRQGDDDD